jgi:hypothetical protein
MNSKKVSEQRKALDIKDLQVLFDERSLSFKTKKAPLATGFL